MGSTSDVRRGDASQDARVSERGSPDSSRHITHTFGTYESRRTAEDAKPFARGIHSIQLFNGGTRWWIVTVYWDSERPNNPIPEKYLPK